MAKRIRDYKAEEARRNELARERGFTTRAAERGARERADWEKVGYGSHREYVQARAQAREWSEKHSQKPVSKFRPSFTPQQTRNYVDAFRVRPQEKHRSYIQKLAEYLHEIDPEEYPDYDPDSEFWQNY